MINEITQELAKRPSNIDSVNNFYYGNSIDAQRRLKNITKYLSYYVTNPPKYILIGEAPGHKGCALSGIPFTSQYVISNSNFFKNKIYISGGAEKENTATIMWSLFDDIERYPLLWNAFPFHPHKKNSIKTNRKPNKRELQEGLLYINILKDIFPKAKLIAVGNVAFHSLDSLGLNIQKVRHPSFGGKKYFLEQMSHYLK